MPFSSKLHHRKLICPHRASPDISHLSGPDEIMQCFHSLFNWYIGIEAVDLQKIEVIGSESLQGGIDGVEDCLAGKA